MNHRAHRAHRDLIDSAPALSGRVIGAAIHVHEAFGPGLLESVYEQALAVELALGGVQCQRQVPVPVVYRDQDLGLGFRADLVVGGSLLVEIKAVEKLVPVHTAQVITYLKLLRLKRGLLINFNQTWWLQGIRRISI